MSTDVLRGMTDATGEATVLSIRVRVALFAVALALAALTLAACQKDASPDSFVGPSELALSLALRALPDVLPLDGASQSLVSILVRDGSGQVVANVALRLQISVGGVLRDYGLLSSRTLVTGQDGRAVATYTAPLAVSGVDTGAQVEILVTPVGDNYASAVPRTLAIRLVPNGVVIPPNTLSAGFRYTPSSPAEFQEILFETNCLSDFDTNCVRGAVTYAWDFGDGATGSGATVAHAYSTPSTFTVGLTVTDAFSRSITASRQVTVVSGGTPTASFTFSPLTPNLDDTVFFNASASTPPPGRKIVSYDWAFGDGGTAAGTTVSHAFGRAATYTVTLTVTDDRGATGSTISRVVVTTGRPSASFVFSPSAPSVRAPVFFDASASRATVAGRTLVSYDWVFGDGATGTGVMVEHRYEFASTYPVTLTVTDSVGEKATTTVSVTAGGTGGVPTASFTVSPSPTTIGTVTVVDATASTASNGATIASYTWNFGDSTGTSTCPAAAGCNGAIFSHTYVAVGSYTITLTVTDSLGQTVTTTQSITVNDTTPPTASFTFTPNSAPAGTTILFDATGSTSSFGRSITNYFWDLGDGLGTTVDSGTSPTISGTYPGPGAFTVTLTVTDKDDATGLVIRRATVTMVVTVT